MKKNLLLLSVLIINAFFGISQKRKAEKDTKVGRYELEGIAEGAEGTYLVKVWSYNKKDKIAINQAKKNAVHGIIFKGFTGKGRVGSQDPLCTNPNAETENTDFFSSFFDEDNKDGFLKFISESGDGTISPDDIKKVDKEYKIGVVVSVNKDLLKNHLKNKGVIKSMGDLFDK
jgi:hypothetical protein